MTKLTDVQAILLSSAVQRDSGHLLPCPQPLTGKDEPARKVIQQLIRRGFAAEAPTTDAAQQLRAEGEQRFGATITEAGKQAIGAVEPGGSAERSAGPDIAAPPQRTDTKQARVIGLLQREQGASITEIVEASGWLPHTTRAALTGLRKRGLMLDKSKVNGVTRYKVAPAQ